MKREIAKLAAGNRTEAAESEIPKPLKHAQLPLSAGLRPTKEWQTDQRGQITKAEMPSLPPATTKQVTEGQPKQQPRDLTAFFDGHLSYIDTQETFVQRQLTIKDMKDYARRTYHSSFPADSITTVSN